jgi:hypothetical protein
MPFCPDHRTARLSSVTKSTPCSSPMLESVMPLAQQNPLFSCAEIGILACSKCGNPMRLVCTEATAPGQDVRTYECAKCNTSERFAVTI